jgi:hypothetical protein
VFYSHPVSLLLTLSVWNRRELRWSCSGVVE